MVSPSNDWHYVTISKKNENVFIWKNRAGVEWDLTLDGKEIGGVVKFKVGKKCCNNKDKDKVMTFSRWGRTVPTIRMATLRLYSPTREIE